MKRWRWEISVSDGEYRFVTHNLWSLERAGYFERNFSAVSQLFTRFDVRFLRFYSAFRRIGGGGAGERCVSSHARVTGMSGSKSGNAREAGDRPPRHVNEFFKGRAGRAETIDKRLELEVRGSREAGVVWQQGWKERERR